MITGVFGNVEQLTLRPGHPALLIGRRLLVSRVGGRCPSRLRDREFTRVSLLSNQGEAFTGWSVWPQWSTSGLLICWRQT